MRRRNRILAYIRKHGSIRPSDKQAKIDTGFSLKPRKPYNKISHYLDELCQDGIISGVKIRGRWEYHLI